jgi:ABC-type polysaccharide/polyol phosphate transport system ATPase subunit
MTAGSVIDVEGVGKRFRVSEGGTRTLKSSVLSWLKGSRRRDFWALKDVGFSVGRGETLGIIGANGAGKSTLLALVAGTMEPTEGSIRSRGTIASLLELGTGFHPDLTGRENVLLFGAVLGLSRRHMRGRMDSIIEFSGIGEFIDEPVKHYSSGMYVRLGFAVAVEVDPDILLVDEVLAVGDATFQRKCLARMEEFRRRGKTMLIVSHDLQTIQRMSDRILMLDRGTVVGLGEPGAVVGQYRASRGQQAAAGIRREWGTGEVKISDVRFEDESGRAADRFAWGRPVTVRLRYRAAARVADPVFGFGVSDGDGRLLHGSNTQIAGIEIPFVEGEGEVTLRMENLTLASGSYLFSFSVHSSDHRTNYHRLDNWVAVAFESAGRGDGCCFFPSAWEVRTK